MPRRLIISTAIMLSAFASHATAQQWREIALPRPFAHIVVAAHPHASGALALGGEMQTVLDPARGRERSWFFFTSADGGAAWDLIDSGRFGADPDLSLQGWQQLLWSGSTLYRSYFSQNVEARFWSLERSGDLASFARMDFPRLYYRGFYGNEGLNFVGSPFVHPTARGTLVSACPYGVAGDSLGAPLVMYEYRPANGAWTLLADSTVSRLTLPAGQEPWSAANTRSAISYGEPMTILINSAMGLFGSADASRSWSTLTVPDTLRFRYELAMAVHPLDSRTFFIAFDGSKGGGALLRSRDGGSTWTQVLPRTVTSIAFPYERIGEMAVASGKDVLLSSDLGDSWLSLPALPAACVSLHADGRFSPPALYAAADSTLYVLHDPYAVAVDPPAAASPPEVAISPQPVRAGGMAMLQLRAAPGVEPVARVFDLLGRSRAVLRASAPDAGGNCTITVRTAALGLEPGRYPVLISAGREFRSALLFVSP